MSGREQKEMKRDHEDVQKRFNKQHVYSPQVAVYLQIRESAQRAEHEVGSGDGQGDWRKAGGTESSHRAALTKARVFTMFPVAGS